MVPAKLDQLLWWQGSWTRINTLISQNDYNCLPDIVLIWAHTTKTALTWQDMDRSPVLWFLVQGHLIILGWFGVLWHGFSVTSHEFLTALDPGSMEARSKSWCCGRGASKRKWLCNVWGGGKSQDPKQADALWWHDYWYWLVALF